MIDRRLLALDKADNPAEHTRAKLRLLRDTAAIATGKSDTAGVKLKVLRDGGLIKYASGIFTATVENHKNFARFLLALDKLLLEMGAEPDADDDDDETDKNSSDENSASRKNLKDQPRTEEETEALDDDDKWP